MLRLLREDDEFRYTVAGLIGLDEILKRLDKNEAQFNRIGDELVRLREDMLQGFKRHDEILEKQASILEEHATRMTRLEEELVRLREDMNRGFELVDRHLSALGARWGLDSEEAFRQGLRGLIEKEFGWKVERWEGYDEEGFVFGHPSKVEVNIALHDERIVLIEVTSHARFPDLYVFERKALLYERKTGKKPSRLVLVTPYMDEKAIEVSKSLGIEVYTKV